MHDQPQKVLPAHQVLPATTSGWVVRTVGTAPTSQHFHTKREALAYGRKVSREQGTGLVVYSRDGRVLSSWQPRSHAREQQQDRPQSGFGCARGLIVIGPDFDEPLEDLSNYM